jgi:opacity protein-like surface antigen
MPTKAPPVAGIFDWSGFYIGGHLGYGGTRMRFGTGTDADHKLRRAFWGMQWGQNWQRGNVVFGWESDISVPSSFTSRTAGSAMIGKLDLFSSLRGRLGLAFNRVLVYATGGGAYIHGKFANSSGTGAKRIGSFVPVAGAGIEWAYDQHLILRIEGLNYFVSKTFTNPDGELLNINNVLVGRIGASYKF